MIKTDGVIYRIKTKEEYDWLMGRLHEVGCRWLSGAKLPKIDIFSEYGLNCCVRLANQRMTHQNFDFYKNEAEYKDYEFIEVSDLMKNEEKENLIKTDSVIYHTETQKEYDWLTEKLEAAGCKCNVSQIPPTKMDGWQDYGSETGLQVLKNVI